LTGKVQGFDSVIIKGADQAMENVVKLAELVKHRIANIHQVNSITNMTMVDEYEPLEEGLDHLKFERHLTVLTITLSKNV
jgi:ribonucleases P/MRP protein subunit RPP25